MQLQSCRLENLEDLRYEACILYATELPGEAFHPEYKRNKRLFKQLISTSIKLEKQLRDYFRELADRVGEQINWADYYQKAYKGSLFSDYYNWEGDLIKLQTTLTGTLDDIFEAGGISGLEDLGVIDEFSSQDQDAIKALKGYTLQLATDIISVTKERIKQSILRSIELGENQDQATARLVQIVNNKKRAAMIAHTETVRAFSMGKIAAGQRLNAKFKVWRDGQPGACVICTNLHGKAVKFNSSFKTITGGQVDFAPAHPWCKCLTKLVLDKSFLRKDEVVIE